MELVWWTKTNFQIRLFSAHRLLFVHSWPIHWVEKFNTHCAQVCSGVNDGTLNPKSESLSSWYGDNSNGPKLRFKTAWSSPVFCVDDAGVVGEMFIAATIPPKNTVIYERNIKSMHYMASPAPKKKKNRRHVKTPLIAQNIDWNFPIPFLPLKLCLI